MSTGLDTADDSVRGPDVSGNGSTDGMPQSTPPSGAQTTITGLPDVMPPDVMRDKTGAVILKADGTPRKRPGRKKGQANRSETNADSGAESTPAPQTPAEKRAISKSVKISTQETARAVLLLGVGAAVSFLGPEWDFESQEEADGMKAALAGYLEAKGGGEMSPEMGLFLVVSGYILARMKHPTAREKIFGAARRAFSWIKGRVHAS